MLDGMYDGLVMAAAGVKRLGLEEYITEYLDLEMMMTAPGQAAIAVEVRSDDNELRLIAESLNDEETNMCVNAERSFLNNPGGGCHVPFAAYSNIIENGLLRIDALVSSLDGVSIVRKTNFGEKEKYMSIGLELAEMILSSGGEKIIKSLKLSRKIDPKENTELLVEELRSAILEIGRLTGSIDVEEYLEVIFKDFCIGK